MHICEFLDDYTTDRRGDIGSSIRLEALHGVQYILRSISQAEFPPYVYELMQRVIRLSAEKMDKVRLEAWGCLKEFWNIGKTLPPLKK